MTPETFVQHAFSVFNFFEGLLWLGVAVGLACVYHKRRRNADLTVAAGLLFMTFGLSDFVEIQTGGWYKPWWLLAWKASDLVGLLVVYRIHRRRLRT